MPRGLREILIALLLIVTASAATAADPNDRAGSKDPPVFTRMPGFHIERSDELEFDRVEFWVARGKSEFVEDRHYSVSYSANEGIKHPSGLQVLRNYENANKSAGGQTVYETEDGGTLYLTLKLTKGDSEFWTEVSAASNGRYRVSMVEKKQMTQAVRANAEAWAGTIRETGGDLRGLLRYRQVQLEAGVRGADQRDRETSDGRPRVTAARRRPHRQCGHARGQPEAVAEQG